MKRVEEQQVQLKAAAEAAQSLAAEQEILRRQLQEAEERAEVGGGWGERGREGERGPGDCY